MNRRGERLFFGFIPVRNETVSRRYDRDRRNEARGRGEAFYKDRDGDWSPTDGWD